MAKRSDDARTAPRRRGDRRLVVGFSVMALVVSGALGILQSHTGLNGGIVELTQAGPLLAVVVVFLLSPRVRRLITGGLKMDRRSLAALAMAVLAVLATMCCYRVILAAMGASASGLTARDWPGRMAVVVPAQLAGALAEEAGWRGVLQPLLRRHLSLVPASGAVGVIWALWHVPTISSGMAIAVPFTVGCVGLSLLLGVLTDQLPRGRVWVAGTFHWLLNLAMLLVLDQFDPARTLALALAALLAGTAAVVVQHSAVRRRVIRPLQLSRVRS
jgi:membrane protease YdiL (CAAX protease family)